MAIRQSSKGIKIDPPVQGINIWLRASDATALHSDLKKQGFPIVEDLRKSPFGMTFSFRDPDGYILAVHDGG